MKCDDEYFEFVQPASKVKELKDATFDSDNADLDEDEEEKDADHDDDHDDHDDEIDFFR